MTVRGAGGLARSVLSPFNVLSLLLLGAGTLVHFRAQESAPALQSPRYGSPSQRQNVTVTLYFSDPQVRGFRPEKRVLGVERTALGEVAQAAADALAQGPREGGLPVVPKGGAAPVVWARGEHLFADFPAVDAKLSLGASGERMLACAFAQTLLSLPGARDVTFLVGGKNADTLQDNFDIRTPITKDDCKM